MKLTKEMLIDWIDRPPSNSDLDLINYIIDLQNNRDKATEYVEKHTDKLKNIIVPKIDFDYKELLNKLKGDSDD